MTVDVRPKRLIPESVRAEFAARLLRHVGKKWKGRVGKILLRFRGAYVYVAAIGTERNMEAPPQVCRYMQDGEVPIQLCRLGYLGSIDRWVYAFFKYSDECYAPSVVASGSFEATSEQAFDCAAAVYLHE